MIDPTPYVDTIRLIANHAHDWVDVCGQQSELIHDLIDESAVQVGRQGRVGNGKPMTAWFADIIDQSAMLDHVLHPLVGCDWRAVVMFAPEELVKDYNRSFFDLILSDQATATVRWLVDVPSYGTAES